MDKLTIRDVDASGKRVFVRVDFNVPLPDGKVQDGLRLRPVAERLSQLLRMSVPCTGDALGVGTEDAIRRLRPGEALLLENLRFHAEEEANDPGFARTLASYADLYVN